MKKIKQFTETFESAAAKVSKNVLTGVLMAQFDDDEPLPLMDIFDNNYSMTLTQSEKTDECYRDEFERYKSSGRCRHLHIGDSRTGKSFSVFIKPIAENIESDEKV